MKMKNVLMVAMVAVLLTGCGDSTSVEESRKESVQTEASETEDVQAESIQTGVAADQNEAEYIGTFGNDVTFNNITDCKGCEFDITMVYQTKDTEGKYVFTAIEKSADGSTAGLFRVADRTEGNVLTETANYNATDKLAVNMKVVLDNIVYYESDKTGEITIEYEATAKEATLLPLDSAEAKLARSGYFSVGDTIDFESGLSVYIVSTGYSTYLDGQPCVYVEVEITNKGEEEAKILDMDFYGDDYALDRAYFEEGNIEAYSYLAPGRKVHGYYAAAVSQGSCSVIEAEIGNAIVMVDYLDGGSNNLNIYGAYTYDNGVDAVVTGDVGFYTDYEGDYVYLAALYYDSNHYTAEVQGTLEHVSDNTYYVKDEITGTVELEVTFVEGGMEVTILSSESDEYNVLEGYYEMTSELNMNEVG